MLSAKFLTRVPVNLIYWIWPCPGVYQTRFLMQYCLFKADSYLTLVCRICWKYHFRRRCFKLCVIVYNGKLLIFHVYGYDFRTIFDALGNLLVWIDERQPLASPTSHTHAEFFFRISWTLLSPLSSSNPERSLEWWCTISRSLGTMFVCGSRTFHGRCEESLLFADERFGVSYRTL